MVFLLPNYLPVFCRRSIGFGYRFKYKHVIILGKKKKKTNNMVILKANDYLKYELLFDATE